MRCGCKEYKGKLIPANAEIAISPKGREFYLTGIENETAIIKFIDNDEVFRMSLFKYNKTPKNYVQRL